MTPEQIEALFTRDNGEYVFARWGRPLAPVVFGVEKESLGVIRGAVEAVATLAGLELVETDPELGANLMVFLFREWDELLEVPNLDKLVPELASTVDRLKLAEANQYRVFRFDEADAIKASFVFLRMDSHMIEAPLDALALSQAVQIVLLWSESAFNETSSLARLKDGTTVLRPDIADVIRAAYDPVMPPAAKDKSHALRMAARLQGGA